MNAVVLVPYRDDGFRRKMIWERIAKSWDGWRVVLGDNDDEEFDRAASINKAAEEAGRWDVAIVSDSDCLLSHPRYAEEACRLALRDYAYVVPHGRLVDVTRGGTDRIIAGRNPALVRRKATIALVWGGMFAVPRKMWDETGGFDRQFWGYGGEDLAFLVACATIGGQLRIDEGDLYHLWHGWIPGRKETEGYERNMRIVQEYRQHVGDPAGMRAFLETRR